MQGAPLVGVIDGADAGVADTLAGALEDHDAAT